MRHAECVAPLWQHEIDLFISVASRARWQGRTSAASRASVSAGREAHISSARSNFGGRTPTEPFPSMADGGCGMHTLQRLVDASPICVRRVFCWSVFPLVPALCSTASAAGCPALFGGFFATMAESDFSCPCITGFGSSPSRCGPGAASHLWSVMNLPVPTQGASAMPGSPTALGLTGARDSAPVVLPSAKRTASAPRIRPISRLNGWPMRSPADASPASSRCLRTARGRCGLLLLHRSGLPPPTPCRSPGALSSRPLGSSKRCEKRGNLARAHGPAIAMGRTGQHWKLANRRTQAAQ